MQGLSWLWSPGRRLLAAAIVGICLAALGWVLISLGGWGPCGPASTTAEVGGWLCFYHAVLVCTWLPGLELWLVQVGVASFVLSLLPAFDWTVIAFLALTLAAKLWKPKPAAPL